MIRDRRDEDLDRLCAILTAMGHPRHGLSTDDLRGWLVGQESELSWVFDQAPVTVAPTKNVIGHAQIYRPSAEPLVHALEGTPGLTASGTLVIGRLFVRPDRHAAGVARFLLREAVRHIDAQQKQAVLELTRDAHLPWEVCARLGFVEVPSDAPDIVLMTRQE